jgi:hypothetical protein
MLRRQACFTALLLVLLAGAPMSAINPLARADA